MRLIVATRSSGPPASGKIIKEMPSSVASGTLYIKNFFLMVFSFPVISLDTSIVCWLGVRYTGLKFMTGYHIY